MSYGQTRVRIMLFAPIDYAVNLQIYHVKLTETNWYSSEMRAGDTGSYRPGVP
eukprot:UN18144